MTGLTIEQELSKANRTIRRRCAQLFVLNILDTILTLVAVMIYAGVELNPIMATIIVASPILFASIKLLIGSTLFWFLYKMRPGQIRKIGSAICLIAYWIIVLQNGLIVFFLAVTT